MSRLDLDGYRPSCLDASEVEFEFGVPLDEDDIERSPSPCEEIDAVNTETFGEDVDAADFDDLEVYSKQTAGLKLDDYEESAWNNEPSCSLSPPDPSQLPDPNFEVVTGVHDNAHSTHPYIYRTPSGIPYSSSYELNLGTVDSLFTNNLKGRQNSIWGAPDLSNVISRSAVDFINKRDGVESVTCTNVKTEMYSNNDNVSSTFISSHRPELAEIPKNAMTVEELERQQLKEAHTKKLPVVPQGAITLEDLEKQMIFSAPPVKREMKPVEFNASTDTKPLINPKFPLSPQLPLSFPVPNPMIHPYMLNLYRARMAGQLIDSPKFPMVPPQMRLAFFDAMSRNINGVGGYRHPVSPLPGILFPPFASMVQTSRMRMNNMHLPGSSRVSFFGQYQSHSTSSSTMYRDVPYKKTGLPSNKTISDFAFDPYAGFMSKKEREWLIKIQLLQCQGTGNPYDDDYYYTVWRERKLSLRQTNSQVISERNDCDTYTTSNNSNHYVPPSFVGSLGKPLLSTVNNPRQLIDLHYDGSEEDDRSSLKASTQKRFRALLMLVENLASNVLLCEDRKRQLNSTSLSSETRELLDADLRHRQELLLECLCSDKLTKIISLNKGRHMLVRTFALLNSSRQLKLFNVLIAKSLATVLKVVDEDELILSLLPTLISYLMHCSAEDLVNIFASFVIDETVLLQPNLSNKFLCSLIITLLYCLYRKNIEMDKECRSSSLFAYLCGSRCPLSPPNSWAASLMKMAGIDQTDFQSSQRWLESQFRPYADSVGLSLTLTL